MANHGHFRVAWDLKVSTPNCPENAIEQWWTKCQKKVMKCFFPPNVWQCSGSLRNLAGCWNFVSLVSWYAKKKKSEHLPVEFHLHPVPERSGWKPSAFLKKTADSSTSFKVPREKQCSFFVSYNMHQLYPGKAGLQPIQGCIHENANGCPSWTPPFFLLQAENNKLWNRNQHRRNSMPCFFQTSSSVILSNLVGSLAKKPVEFCLETSPFSMLHKQLVKNRLKYV